MLAHNTGILALGQRVIVALTLARFGLLDARFLKSLRHRIADVLGAVVGVKAQDHKRELLDDQLQHGQQKSLADAMHGFLNGSQPRAELHQLIQTAINLAREEALKYEQEQEKIDETTRNTPLAKLEEYLKMPHTEAMLINGTLKR